MTTLDNYLYANKNATDNITHTRIGDRVLKIYSGKYSITDQDEFNQLYFEKVFLKGQPEYLTEKQNGLCIAVDLDFRYASEMTTRQYTPEIISLLIATYSDELKNFYNFTEQDEYNIYLMEKKDVTIQEDDQPVKDGVHIIIGLKMSHALQGELRKAMIEKAPEIFEGMHYINSIDDIFDNAITTGQNNWIKYGSGKPSSNNTYKLTKIWRISYDMIDNEAMMNVVDIETFNNEKRIKMISTTYLDNPKFELIPRAEMVSLNNEILSNSSSSSSNSSHISNKSDYYYLKKGISKGLLTDSTKSYKDWFKMGCAIKNTFSDNETIMCEVWDDICQLNPAKYDKDGSQDFIKQLKDNYDKPITIAYPMKLMKTRDINLFNELKEEICILLRNDRDQMRAAFLENVKNMRKKARELKDKEKLEKEQEKIAKKQQEKDQVESAAEQFQEQLAAIHCEYDPDPVVDELLCQLIEVSYTEYTLAKLIVTKYGENFKCLNEKEGRWAEYVNKIWNIGFGNSVRAIASNKLTDYFNSILLLEKLQPAPDDEKVDREWKQQTRSKIQNIINRLGKTSDKNNIVREIAEQTFKPKFCDDFNRQFGHLPLKNGLLYDMITNTCRERTIDDKFTYECDVDLIELTPEKEIEYDLYFESLFCGNKETAKCFVDVLKTAVSGRILKNIFFLTGELGNNGKSSLFNILKSVFTGAMDTISKNVIIDAKQKATINTEVEKLDKIRIGYVSELRNTDTLNMEMIKTISGNDPIDLRGLRATNVTINPTSNLFALTNQMPKLVVEPAIMQRLIIFPFNNQFEINAKFEKEKIADRSNFFSYLMKKGDIIEKVVPTGIMKVASNNYTSENDNLNQFINEKVEFIEGGKMLSTTFKDEFEFWCSKADPYAKKMTKTALTKQLKIYKIDSKESNGQTKYMGIKLKTIAVGLETD
jgi:phage/plasmid-associated DNA primase